MIKKIYRYMVVDDDPTNNMICKYLILKQDKEAAVSLFEKPETALNELKKNYNKPDKDLKTILFLDINMPTMTGWEFLDEFETFDSVIRDHFIIYVLTSAIQNFEKEAERYPFVSGFLSKPLKAETFNKIREAAFESEKIS